jgi:hypothetical protein
MLTGQRDRDGKYLLPSLQDERFMTNGVVEKPREALSKAAIRKRRNQRRVMSWQQVKKRHCFPL